MTQASSGTPIAGLGSLACDVMVALFSQPPNDRSGKSGKKSGKSGKSCKSG